MILNLFFSAVLNKRVISKSSCRAISQMAIKSGQKIYMQL